MSLNQFINTAEKKWLNVHVNSLTSTGEFNFRDASGGSATFNQWIKTTGTINSAGDFNALRSVNLVNPSGGTIALTSPPVSDSREVCLINIGSDSFTLASSQIGGSLSYAVPSGETLTVVSNGSGWFVKSCSRNVLST